MEIGSSTFSGAGTAVSDLFAGFGAQQAGALKAQGLDIEAQGTDITAQSLLLKAQGDIAEGKEYTLAQQLAQQNATYTKASTAIQAAQEERQVTMTIGGQRAAVGGAGLAESGSAQDLLRSSASQGALATSVIKQQGLINEAGYEEQAQSYGIMASAANATAAGETTISGEESQIANEQRQLARETQHAANVAATGDFISAAIAGAGAIASLAP